MKHLTAALSLVLLFTLPHLAFGSTDVTIATTGDSAPANSSDPLNCKQLGVESVSTEDGRTLCGFEIDLMRALCQQNAWNCRWVIEPLAPKTDPTALPGLLENLNLPDARYDLAINYMRGTEARLLALAGSGTYYEGHPSIYVSVRAMDLVRLGKILRKDNQFPLPLNGKIRIATLGYYEKEIKTHYTADELERIEIIQIPGLKEQIQKLASGEIDFVFGPDHQRLMFEVNGHETYAAHPIATLSNSIELGSRVYAARTDKGLELIRLINEGLLELYTQGTYKAVFDRYKLEDTWGKVNGPKKISGN